MQNQYFSSRDKCPACNSEIIHQLYQVPYDEPPISDYIKSFYSPQGDIEFDLLKNATFNLYECKDCRLIFQKEIPNDYLMKVLYEKWIDPKSGSIQTKKSTDFSRTIYYAQEIATIVRFLQKTPSELRILDYGMGWGSWTLMAKGFGCESYGIDLSTEKIKFAAANGIKTITWEEIPKLSFDFINTEQVFEHLSNPLDTLVYLSDSLQNDGLLKISVPATKDIKRRLKTMDWKAPKGTRNSLNPIAPLEHINCYQRSSLLKMAALAGMKEVVIPIRDQYIFTSNMYSVLNMTKKLLLPLYKNIYNRQSYLFFQKE